MHRKNILRFLLLPVLTGLAATTLVYVYLPDAGPSPAAAEEEWVEVLRTTSTIPAKTELTADMLTRDAVPRRLVSHLAVRDLQEAVGKITRVSLAEGEMVLSSRLAGEDSKSGLAYRVPEGMRAVALAMDAVKGVGGYVQPGDRVDIIVSYGEETEQGALRESILALQDLLVLTVGSRLEVSEENSAAPGDYAHITVAVSPQDAVTLTTVDEFSRIRLALRPAADKGETFPPIRRSWEDVRRPGG